MWLVSVASLPQNLLPLSPKYWDYRQPPFHLAFKWVLELKTLDLVCRTLLYPLRLISRPGECYYYFYINAGFMSIQ